MLILTVVCAIARPALGVEYSCNFEDKFVADDWDLHQAGDGVARVEDGSLLLDMRKPSKGKHTWADLKKTLKAPLTVEWDEQVAEDSPHYYTSGLWLGLAKDGYITCGPTGKPLGNIITCCGARSKEALEVGKWYRFRLHLGADRAARLTVTDAETGETVTELPGRRTGLRGKLVQLGFYHNQERRLGPDEYTQDRGATRIDNLKITAAAISADLPGDYRDRELRGYDPHQPMTFNRTTVWPGEEEGIRGAALAYDRASEILLTGGAQAASWQPNRLCAMVDRDENTSTFVRPNDLDGYDCAALRSFQWCIRQHPTLEYQITPDAGACYLAVTLVCPYLGTGIRVFETEPSTEPFAGTVDMAKIMFQRGLDYHQFVEAGFFVYQDRPAEGDAQGTAQVRLKLTGPGGLITAPGIVRTLEHAAKGVDIYALLAGSNGLPSTGPDTRMEAQIGEDAVQMREVGDTGVFTARIHGLAVGTHSVAIRARQGESEPLGASQRVVVTDGDFASWKPDQPTYQLRSGKVLPCLLGDLYAWVPMVSPTSVNRRVIVSAEMWNGLSENEKKACRLVKLRTLNPGEILAQLRAYRDHGTKVIRLTPNVTPHESYLDAGGHVSMHGLETLQVVLDACRSLGMKAVVNLFHYPYWSGGTGSYPPWRQYIDAGYAGAHSFTSPKLRPMLKQYLREVLTFLRDDPAVLAYSLTGENDQTYGPEFINDLFEHVMACDPNHMVTQEQGGGIEHCAGGLPWAYDGFAPTKSAGLGYRTYYTSGARSDAYFMVCARAYGCNHPVFCAEFASGPGWYGGFATWVHPDFLTKVRDNCWASLIGQQTMCVSWSAPWTQIEREIPNLCGELIDWNHFVRASPRVAVIVDKIDRSNLERMAGYEWRLARMGVDYDYLWAGRNADVEREKYDVVLDATQSDAPAELPQKALADRPVLTGGEYSVSYLLSRNREQMVAFVRNTAEYKLGPGYGHGVWELHRQRVKTSPLQITLNGMSAHSAFKVFDVDRRRLVRQGDCGPKVTIDLGETNHDYAVVVTRR